MARSERLNGEEKKKEKNIVCGHDHVRCYVLLGVVNNNTSIVSHQYVLFKVPMTEVSKFIIIKLLVFI